MFSKVVAEAKEYTRPVVIYYRFADGSMASNIGTFVHVDDVGHILSASHIFKMGSEDPIKSVSVIFDGRYLKAEYIADDIPNDIVLLKLQDYKSGSIKVFPKFLKSSFGELPPGTPLVRLGYPKGPPYSEIPIAWDEANERFLLNETETKLTCFHNDGCVTQYVDRDNDVRLLEMNTPALMGQSGGPVLLDAGTLVGLQSRNTVLEFATNPPVETGLAASHIVIAKFLETHGIAPAAWI